DPMLVQEEGLHPQKDSLLSEPPARMSSESEHQAVDIPVRREDITRETSSSPVSSAQGIRIPVQGASTSGAQESDLQNQPTPKKGQGGAPFAPAETPKKTS